MEASFANGSLRTESYARPGKLFTASRELMVGQVAILRQEALDHLVESVIAILRGGRDG
jgi:mRNA interferase MazF